MVPDRLEAKQAAEQQQRRAGRPRLGTASRRILHWVSGHVAWVPAERFREATVEEDGRVQDALGDASRLLLEPVPS